MHESCMKFIELVQNSLQRVAVERCLKSRVASHPSPCSADDSRAVCLEKQRSSGENIAHAKFIMP